MWSRLFFDFRPPLQQKRKSVRQRNINKNKKNDLKLIIKTERLYNNTENDWEKNNKMSVGYEKKTNKSGGEYYILYPSRHHIKICFASYYLRLPCMMTGKKREFMPPLMQRPLSCSPESGGH